MPYTARRYLNRRLAIALAMGGLLAASTVGPAGAAEPRDPIQREDIALIQKQLARIDLVVDRLAQHQRGQPDRRVILDVSRLRADIDDIRAGLAAYLSPPRIRPRRPPPLSGDYRAQRAGATP